MSMSKQTDEIKRLRTVTDEWEKRTGKVSALHAMGSAIPKVAAVCADLTDDEIMVVLTAMGEARKEEKLSFRQKLFEPLAKFVLDNRSKYAYSELREVEYYAILAPAWNALYGLSEDPGYAMGQAMYKFRDDNDGTSTEPLRSGPQAAAKRIDLIADMIAYTVGSGRIDEDELGWFGANWKAYGPVWSLLLDNRIISRSRAEALIANMDGNVPAAIISGSL